MKYTRQTRLLLLSDLFELGVVMPEGARDAGSSPGACRALTDLCRDAGRDLHNLLDTVPADGLNWRSTDVATQRRSKDYKL